MLIEPFLCRKDNIAVLLHDEVSRKTIAIDASDGTAILEKLDKMGWLLDIVFITHHHADHTEGIHILKEKTGSLLIGPEDEKEKIPGLDRTVRDGETINTGFCLVQAIEMPGHTLGSMTYYIPQEKHIFTGDTLFSLGCGRPFEGSAAMLFSSLQKFNKIPDDTQVYCGHEYTVSNGYFALMVDPHNQVLQKRMANVIALRQCGKLALPSTMSLERMTNPFLRSADPKIRINLNLINASDESVFAELRERKDNF
ncbi:MAG: hydroxyacylglutathione hydrolase [Candidatus Tokpelaia sp. JSC085]|nr:MAG: hydroxyacylglutathione hydrolase [Candidatus Tokpelaia sp. JSC085]